MLSLPKNHSKILAKRVLSANNRYAAQSKAAPEGAAVDAVIRAQVVMRNRWPIKAPHDGGASNANVLLILSTHFSSVHPE